jgi:hypothetical protein
MEIILRGYFTKFIDEFELDNNPNKLSDNFEFFAAYVIISNELVNPSLEVSDLENVSVAKNKGIDSIAIIVNNKLATTLKELEDLLGNNSTANVDILFIQTKTSESFEDPELGNFCDTIKDFLYENPKYDMTQEAKDYHEMLLHIYEKLAYIKSFNSKAFYACSGKWTDENSIAKTLKIKENEIKNEHSNFKNGNFSIIPCDKTSLIKLYDKATTPLKTEFKLNNLVSLSNLPPNIDEAHIGLIEFKDFKKIITDPDTGRIRSLFYDNVRDDLGIENPVNQKISQTLTEKKFFLFPLLNNGVTIIAEKNEGTSNKFILNNFQIVNGCQTSNVIFNHINEEGIDQLVIPIKLIVTKDSDVRDNIIVATNQQTEIKEEQLIALSEFQKELEKFYLSNSDGIYYERRTNQYKGTSIKKKNIIDLREQIKSFVAIFMEEPHMVSGYFGKIYTQNKDKIFLETHKHLPYYFAGLMQYKFKDLLNKRLIDRKYNKIRYHIFMIFRKIHEPEDFNFEMLKKKKQSYIESLINSLDENRVLENFKKAFDLIDSSGIDLNSSKEIYKKSTTNTILDKFKEVYK